MPGILLKFEKQINVSLAKGDRVYATSINPSMGTFNHASIDDLFYLGECLTTSFDSVNEKYNLLIEPANPEYVTPNSFPTDAKYIMFSKNNVVNVANVKGYYAELEFVNNSTEKAELFSVGVGVEQSSK